MVQDLFADATPPGAAVDLPRCRAPDGLLCLHCGAAAFRTSWQSFANGTRHVRADCARCGAFVRWPIFRSAARRLSAITLPTGCPISKR